ncbi:MAG: c-type cytochrome biogenesis protein CcsB [Candidatus Phosphoribacter sp.]|nr:c-type cytochrome biogenesis protein CcsB [Actinomycetales bacterium]
MPSLVAFPGLAALQGLTGAAPPTGLASAATSPELASAANLALYSSMAVFTITMLLYAAYLAALGPDPSLRRAGEPARELVGAGAGASGTSGSPNPSDAATTGATSELAGASAGSGAGAVVGSGAGAAAGAAGGPSMRARKLAGSAFAMTCLATVLLVASVALRGLSVMRAPWGNMFEFATAGAAAAAVAYCLLARRNRWDWLGLFVVGPILLTLGTSLLAFYTEAAELMPALKSVWLVIHVIVAILAVGLFVIAFSVGILYLIKAHREADANTRPNFLETLPSAASLERTAYGLNMVGFILWTFTLVAGAIWAQKAWGAYWTWDPKEVWTFVVWVVYAAYMHARATAGWEPRKAMWIALAGFGTVIINFAVVNVFFVGQHSYSGL